MSGPTEAQLKLARRIAEEQFASVSECLFGAKCTGTTQRVLTEGLRQAATAAIAALDQHRGTDAQGGWIVSNGDQTQWRTWGPLGPDWTVDRDQATRYARRQDAELAHAEDLDAWSIVPYGPVSGDEALREENARLREALENAANAIDEMFRYFDGGETRGSYDGKPERAQLRKAGYAVRAALTRRQG